MPPFGRVRLSSPADWPCPPGGTLTRETVSGAPVPVRAALASESLPSEPPSVFLDASSRHPSRMLPSVGVPWQYQTLGGRPPRGGLAQLVEHLLCKQGVNGSSPLSSTREREKRSLTCCERREKKKTSLAWRAVPPRPLSGVCVVCRPDEREGS